MLRLPGRVSRKKKEREKKKEIENETTANTHKESAAEDGGYVIYV